MAQTSSARGEDLGAGGHVLGVGDRGADAGVLLDEDLVAVADELVHAGGGDGHAVLVVLDLAGDADLHVDHGPWLRGKAGAMPIHTRTHDGTPGGTAVSCGKASLMKVFSLSTLTKL